ncbi:protein YIPF1-like [Babylonia areolata]|uniref:protein YIPF1-like n=1 Tax=Babylonia areolata TaxID=304850 RepID=UPI003FD4C48C
MASSVTIDVDSEKSRDSELQFQDIPHDDDWTPMPKPQSSQDPGKTHTFTNFPHSAADSDDEDDSEKTEFIKDKKNASFWTFEYYQQFFDVETMQVGGRILGSMLPRPHRNYLESHIRPNPDLYGPFWICTTLVFTTGIAGNLANYLQAAGQNYQWVYDFHKVTFAATAIFSYWWVVPFILFGLLWWRGNPERYTFLELICLYGYSLAIYIPISLLWVIPVAWLQWLLVVLGAVLSGSALLLAVWPAFKEDKKQVAIGAMVLIFLLHGALAMGFMLYFFHVPSTAAGPTTLAPGKNTTLAPPVNPSHNIPTSLTLQNDNHPSQNNAQSAQGQQSQNVMQPPPGPAANAAVERPANQSNTGQDSVAHKPNPDAVPGRNKAPSQENAPPQQPPLSSQQSGKMGTGGAGPNAQ